jgi:hypothetical protein
MLATCDMTSWYDTVISTLESLQNEWSSFLIHFFFFIYSSVSVFLIWLINSLVVARFTHSVVSRLIRLMSIIVFSAENDLLFVIESTELLLSWIHFISVISRLSYDCLRIITFIISRFSTVISRRTRQSYRDLLSMTSIREIEILRDNILIRMTFSTESTSKSWIIAKSSIVKTLRVIRLHFIENQCKMFVVLIESAKQMT